MRFKRLGTCCGGGGTVEAPPICAGAAVAGGGGIGVPLAFSASTVFPTSASSSRVSASVFWRSPTISKSSFSEGEGPPIRMAARVFSPISKPLSAASLAS